jgi:hypothetical protein
MIHSKFGFGFLEALFYGPPDAAYSFRFSLSLPKAYFPPPWLFFFQMSIYWYWVSDLNCLKTPYRRRDAGLEL